MEKLREIESTYEKECMKLFNLNGIECESNEKYRVNLVHFGTASRSLSTTSATEKSSDLSKLVNLKNMLNVLTRLNSTINLFTGDSTATTNSQEYNRKFSKLFSELNVHASMSGVNDLRNSYFDKYFNNQHMTSTTTTAAAKGNRKLNTVHLCTNIYEAEPNYYDDINSNYMEKTLKPFGQDNHATMIFESNNIKIGFMALADELVYKELKEKIDNDLIVDDQESRAVEYMDYLSEANKMSKQLRTCGANIIVVLAMMADQTSVDRLIDESNDLDLIIRVEPSTKQVDSQMTCEARAISHADADTDKRQAKRWLLTPASVSSASPFPVSHLSMISLRVDPSNLNQITDIAITKYSI